MTNKPFAPLFCLALLPSMGLAADKPVFGLNEYAQLAGLNLEVAAKLDTGAKTASLSARDITRFKRDGETWVRFYLAIDDAHEHPQGGDPAEQPGEYHDQQRPHVIQQVRFDSGRALQRDEVERVVSEQGQRGQRQGRPGLA